MEREGRRLEYKEKVEDFRSICRAVVAFSNDLGGRILIGIRDKDLDVMGLDESDIERLYEDLPKAVYDAINPYVIPQLSVRLIQDKSVMEVTVHKGERPPYFIKAEGTPKGVYCRIGAHNRRATPEIIEDLVRESQNRYWDTELTALDESELDPLTIENHYGNGDHMAQLLADKMMARDPYRGGLNMTHAGLIFFHPQPNRYFPQIEILYSEFEGKETNALRLTKDISGPLPRVLSELMEELEPHLIGEERILGMKREVTRWKIPKSVLREVLLNAMIHRRYSITDAIKVAKFQDRIEVFSPGNFPGPINLEDLRKGVSYARNPTIRQMARKFGLVEKRGLGFRLIFEESMLNGNPPPEVIEGATYVKVIMRFSLGEPVMVHMPEEMLPLENLRENGISFTTPQLMEVLGISKSTARSRLGKLLQDGWVEKNGNGPATQYRWLK